jgi:hypothetical protein
MFIFTYPIDLCSFLNYFKVSKRMQMRKLKVEWWIERDEKRNQTKNTKEKKKNRKSNKQKGQIKREIIKVKRDSHNKQSKDQSKVWWIFLDLIQKTIN